MAALNNLTRSSGHFKLESELVRGTFATIFLAIYKDNEIRTVVAKTVKDPDNKESILKMEAKIQLYESIGCHKNVLQFINSFQDDSRGPIMLLEYCENGTLAEYLEKANSTATTDLNVKLCKIAYDICLGMEFLSSRKVVHRRLAARNIYLNNLDEPKIAGFGLDPKQIAHFSSEPEHIPIKWMAPECMMSTINADELSDVWSFGIVLWEIFSLGDTPYPELQSRAVLKEIEDGYRIKKPEYADDEYYRLMRKCWKIDPCSRPRFTVIKNELENLGVF